MIDLFDVAPWSRFLVPIEGGSDNPLDCTLDKSETTNVVTVRGEIDLSNVHALEEVCDLGLMSSSLPLIVDLSHVGYIDSTGLNTLIKVHERCHVRRVEFAVAFTSRLMWRIFSVLSLQEKIRIFPTVKAATEALQWSPRPESNR
ncbi:MAG TPA: STAS domain-containing protein [bacterium]|nr:STAS domain-containing protein [bacterium]